MKLAAKELGETMTEEDIIEMMHNTHILNQTESNEGFSFEEFYEIVTRKKYWLCLFLFGFVWIVMLKWYRIKCHTNQFIGVRCRTAFFLGLVRGFGSSLRRALRPCRPTVCGRKSAPSTSLAWPRFLSLELQACLLLSACRGLRFEVGWGLECPSMSRMYRRWKWWKFRLACLREWSCLIFLFWPVQQFPK